MVHPFRPEGNFQFMVVEQLQQANHKGVRARARQRDGWEGRDAHVLASRGEGRERRDASWLAPAREHARPSALAPRGLGEAATRPVTSALPALARADDLLGQAAQIVDQQHAHHDWNGPKLANRQWADRLKGLNEMK